MSRINMELRGKRPRFYPGNGTDETISMLLELTAELWCVKERLYALERAADEAGLDLTSRIEAWQPDEVECRELDASRQRLIATVLRAFEAHHAPSRHLRKSLDAEQQAESAGAELPSDNETDRAA
ncbi:MAG: hypothetical protein QNJ73_03525 [Gammaproteobacteria bacterium]|nr:hypothetical protein [Gammaproteobacteria bacterium]